MLSNATDQPKSTVELGYMCPRGLSGPPAVTLTQVVEIHMYKKRLLLRYLKLLILLDNWPKYNQAKNYI